NGTAGFEEHWWYADHGNLRIIGLDSNSSYQVASQLAWLEATLDDACGDPDLDFVFAQLHHPYLSELWLDGETAYTGDVVELLEAFSTDCGKPSVHFFGHTHGYSRGQSRDHQHLWVNAATAGGNIDYWGEYAQADYDEFTVSQDEWGFVVAEVEAGDAPSFRLRRFSRGDEYTALDNDVRDDLVVRRDGAAPATPMAVGPTGEDVNPDCFTLGASAFVEAEGDLHGATHWQISASCDDFDAPVLDRWLQHENWYGDVDLQAGDDLTDAVVEGLSPDTDYCWRARYRDRALSWSDWSVPEPFRTGASLAEGVATADELLENPGAELGDLGWTV
ncbi:MAG: metallophosphoesterase, partial [Proteobacteria bacterium]|nr:metallophosphoesterase [Pseudomonadota bacterium]